MLLLLCVLSIETLHCVVLFFSQTTKTTVKKNVECWSEESWKAGCCHCVCCHNHLTDTNLTNSISIKTLTEWRGFIHLLREGILVFSLTCSLPHSFFLSAFSTAAAQSPSESFPLSGHSSPHHVCLSYSSHSSKTLSMFDKHTHTPSSDSEVIYSLGEEDKRTLNSETVKSWSEGERSDEESALSKQQRFEKEPWRLSAKGWRLWWVRKAGGGQLLLLLSSTETQQSRANFKIRQKGSSSSVNPSRPPRPSVKLTLSPFPRPSPPPLPPA